MTGLELRYVRGHIEVYQRGAFLFSADTEEEARRELLQAPHGFPAGFLAAWPSLHAAPLDNQPMGTL